MSKQAFIRVTSLDPAPDDEEAFKAWCEKYEFRYLGEESGRRAWCGGEFMTYLRGSDGVATLASGDRILYYDADLVRMEVSDE